MQQTTECLLIKPNIQSLLLFNAKARVVVLWGPGFLPFWIPLIWFKLVHKGLSWLWCGAWVLYLTRSRNTVARLILRQIKTDVDIQIGPQLVPLQASRGRWWHELCRLVVLFSFIYSWRLIGRWAYTRCWLVIQLADSDFASRCFVVGRWYVLVGLLGSRYFEGWKLPGGFPFVALDLLTTRWDHLALEIFRYFLHI